MLKGNKISIHLFNFLEKKLCDIYSERGGLLLRSPGFPESKPDTRSCGWRKLYLAYRKSTYCI